MVTINCPSGFISATMPVISSAFLRQMQCYTSKVPLLTLDVHCLTAALHKSGVFSPILCTDLKSNVANFPLAYYCPLAACVVDMEMCGCVCVWRSNVCVGACVGKE